MKRKVYYRCERCGYIIDETEIIVPDEYGDIYCPACGASDWSEGDICEECGEYFREQDGSNGFCLECMLKHSKDYDFLKSTGEPDVDVPLNGFLAWMFRPEEIEKILMETLKQNGTDCSKYIYDFPEEVSKKYWEMIKNRLKNRPLCGIIKERKKQ